MDINASSKKQNTIHLTEDNAVVASAIQDCAKLLNGPYIASVKKTINRLARIGGNHAEMLIKKLIDLKKEINVALDKYSQLGLKSMGSSSEKLNAENNADSDDELEDVAEKEGRDSAMFSVFDV